MQLRSPLLGVNQHASSPSISQSFLNTYSQLHSFRRLACTDSLDWRAIAGCCASSCRAHRPTSLCILTHLDLKMLSSTSLGLRCARLNTHIPGCIAFRSKLVARTPLPRSSPNATLGYRSFTSTPRHRKDDPRSKIAAQDAAHKPEEPDSTRPETIQKKDAAKIASTSTGNDPLLAEQTVSNKEQRKADWAIIKEMSRYLWPKVLLFNELKERRNASTEVDAGTGQPRYTLQSRGIGGLTCWRKGTISPVSSFNFSFYETECMLSLVIVYRSSTFKFPSTLSLSSTA